ncbi:MAG: CusA/CzcA family heavy metal efflux RND transporter [Deltaproteobacteria bacterium]|nr:CusA/CzcA family heavy metal efflux RND transporter [Deltaproteobacteria bacterium]MBU53995.1 CusA/CzcA family heavy metal efflux RND transporter [Deltaproteobacteria bacterium]|tara:strand:- start:18631 stop:21783 length:3153 start_codon:yes stop_codon:yes gene_type:complete
MLGDLPQYALKNRLFILILSMFLVVWGWMSFVSLPIDAVPDLTNVQIQILTPSDGLAPAEIEKQITYPIEQAMAGIPRLEEIRSLSQMSLSVVTVVFTEGTDIHLARQMISERLAIARQDIPSRYGVPSMGPLSTGLGEIFQFEIRSEKRNAMQLRTLLDWYVAPPLRTVPGVVEVNTMGGHLRTYEVTLDPQRLHIYNISVTEVLEVLEQSNKNIGGGYLQRAGEQIVVRGQGLLKGIKDIESLPIKTVEGKPPITIAQLGKVQLKPMPRQGTATRDGRGEVVTGTVVMLQGANARDVIAGLKERLKQIRLGLPKDVQIDPFYDRSMLVQRTLKTVRNNLIEGGILVIIVLFLLLGDLRGGLLVALTIPLSMLFAFICMRWAGISGNLMSLGAIDFGIIVDGSVVMVEHFILVIAMRKVAWESTTQAISQAASEVTRPILFSVGILILVYLPILTLSGTEGKLFRPMAWTVIFALVGALLISLTLMPVLSSFILPKDMTSHETWLMRALQWMYQPVLGFLMQRSGWLIGGAAFLLVAGLGVSTQLGAEFLPRLDEGTLAVQVQRLTSISLKEAIEQSKLVEKSLKVVPEVTSVISKTGRPVIATDPMGLYQSDVYIILKPPHQWRSGMTAMKLVSLMKKKLTKEAPGAEYSFTQPIEMRTAELLEGIRSDVGIKIFGESLSELRKVANEIAAIIRKLPGAADVSVEAVEGFPYMQIKMDYQALGRYGVSPKEVQHTLQAIGGLPAGIVFDGGKRFSLRVRFKRSARIDQDALHQLPVRTQRGKLIALGKLAKIWREDGPVQIQREQGRRRILVQSNVRGRDLTSFVYEAQRKIKEATEQGTLHMPKGALIEWGGQFKQLVSASKRLLLVVPLTLLLIFVLLQMAFRSMRMTLLIYLNIPIAATGGLFALFTRGMPFSISAAVGFIALFGIAVMNGVILLSAIRQNQQDGMAREEAVRHGAIERLRPVMMTALTDAIGFLPMALATSSGAEVQRPLATVVIGGIVTSTFLTLIVLPVMYNRWGEEHVPSENSPDIPTQEEEDSLVLSPDT